MMILLFYIEIRGGYEEDVVDIFVNVATPYLVFFFGHLYYNLPFLHSN